MRPTFHARLVNGPLFDPVVFVRLLNVKSALLFDCGRTGGLTNREILSLDAIFISHLHMDHFMGFDNILRVILHREKPLNVYGPEGIIDRLTAKLGSYTWNLTEEYPLAITIHEVREHDVVKVTAMARNAFQPSEALRESRQGPTIARQAFYSMDAIELDHNVPCLGFVLKEPFHINIMASRIAGLGYVTGPWIGVLKRLILDGCMDAVLKVPGSSGMESRKVEDLFHDLVIVSKGQKICYITDIRASEENLGRIFRAARDVDILFIEAYYLDERSGEAYEKAHLTAAQAGRIAGMLNASKVIPMHISPRYHDNKEMIDQELEGAWASSMETAHGS